MGKGDSAEKSWVQNKPSSQCSIDFGITTHPKLGLQRVVWQPSSSSCGTAQVLVSTTTHSPDSGSQDPSSQRSLPQVSGTRLHEPESVLQTDSKGFYPISTDG